jgi:Domain of unknown function (DUF1906)
MPFAGFDSLHYPGDAVMGWLKANTNLSFVGFYLAPAPSQGDREWMTHRGALASQGWGFSPVYLGQQEVTAPGQHILTVRQGSIDGGDASQLMQTAGFPSNSVVYLDCETGGPASFVVTSYVEAWIDAVTAAGFYRPGIYCSHSTAPSLLAVRPGTAVWSFKLTGPAPGPSYPPNFPVNAPSGCGVASATVWQYAQNLTVPLSGGPVASLKVDLDCASVADPSNP